MEKEEDIRYCKIKILDDFGSLVDFEVRNWMEYDGIILNRIKQSIQEEQIMPDFCIFQQVLSEATVRQEGDEARTCTWQRFTASTTQPRTTRDAHCAKRNLSLK